MPGWRSLVIRVAIGVVLLDLVVVGLHASLGTRAGGVVLVAYALALAGVGWLLASAMMLRALEAVKRENLALEEAAPAPGPVELRGTEDPLHDEAWTGLVESCVELVDELDRTRERFDPARRELTEHVLLRLEEILDRPGIEVIRDEKSFSRDRHQPDRKAAAGSAVVETLSPGFAIGRRVLRRAKVRLEVGVEGE